MKLIILYGPPAVGKLTVAQNLAKKTGYKILHMHMTIDLVTALFDRTTDTYTRLNRIIQLELINAAFQEKFAGLIMTYSYWHPTADEFIQKLLALSKKYSGEIHCIYLTCSEEELLRRVVQSSRKNTGKIQTKKLLQEVLKARIYKHIPYVENIILDTTNMPPELVTQTIMTDF